MKIDKIIKGKRIHLRFLNRKDAEKLVEICNDKSIYKFTHVPYPYKLKDALVFIKGARIKRKKNQEFVYGIINNKTKELVGVISFLRIEKNDNKAEVGYLVGKKYRNKGYATEACKLLLNYGFKKLRFHKIMINCAKENNASKKVIKKIGAKKEALLREDIFVGGKYHNHLIHSILRREWKC